MPPCVSASRTDVLTELEIRKRQRGILGYDDLLTRLADALKADDSPAQLRMHQRWPIVMVDEFQDTDPVQWKVIDRAFTGRSTLILIGDPKQAIYAFRGGDIVTYLKAAQTAGVQKTLATNWRSDGDLVQRLQVILRGAALGDPRIVVHPVDAHHTGSRLSGAPSDEPFRLRVVRRESFGRSGTNPILIGDLRSHIPADMAADIGALLSSGATFDGETVGAGHVAVIVEKHKDARACFDALCEAGIPAVYTGDSDIFKSAAAEDWLCLLEAFDQPHRAGMVRAAAATMFFGNTAESLVAGGDTLTDRVAETLREWAGHARERGVAAIFEAAQRNGMGDRVLSWHGGERQMTDLAHMTQLLQEAAHREHFSLPALRDWLHAQRDEGASAERFRRLDNDAAAVQVMTVFAAKGLQFPVVYLPFEFNRNIQDWELVVFHEGDQRCLYVGGSDGPDFNAISTLAKAEEASDDSRLTYVAMTRAQAQVVAWWAPSKDEPNGGLSRLLRGRHPGEAEVPDRCSPDKLSDDDAMARFEEWEAAGGLVIEKSVARRNTYAARRRAADRSRCTALPPQDRRCVAADVVLGSDPRRGVDPGEQRAGGHRAGRRGRRDPVDDIAGRCGRPVADGGSSDGREVRHAGPRGVGDGRPVRDRLGRRTGAQIREHAMWWPVDVSAADLAAAMVPMHDTPLGPLADGLTLRQIGLQHRMREMDFEFPLAGGDLRAAAPDIRLSHVGELLRAHLGKDDPLATYADRLTGAALGSQPLKGYLSGSVDVVLRIGDRYVVVDYKTNWLGDPAEPLTAADYAQPRLVEAMLHSDYPLQALLYNVVLHRFLRWRLPGYKPETHLGGVMYLFLRGMCGPDTPVVDGHPAGVFSWQPPASLITALSDLLDQGRAAA